MGDKVTKRYSGRPKEVKHGGEEFLKTAEAGKKMKEIKPTGRHSGEDLLRADKWTKKWGGKD